MKSRFLRNRAIPLVLLGLNACAASTETEAPDDEVAMAEQRLLAEAEIPGGSAKFLAIDSDMLLIATITKDVPNPVMDPSIRGLTAAEIYEHWTGEPAPAALLERAFPMSSPLEAESPAAPAAEHDATERVAVATSALVLTSTQFAAAYCNGVRFCLTDQTGTWEREDRSKFWRGAVNAVRNDVSFSMRRREVFGGWTGVWQYQNMPQGYDSGLLRATSETLNMRPLKFKIFDADGDFWHAAAQWE